MDMKKEVMLTSKELEENDIKIVVNQNDIIEMVATERFNKIMSEYKEIQTLKDSYNYNDYKKIYRKEVEKFLKAIDVEVNQTNIDKVVIYSRKYSSNSIKLKFLDLKASKLSFYVGNLSQISEIEIQFSKKSTEYIKKSIRKENSLLYTTNVPVKLRFDLDEIEEYNKKVTKFYEDYGSLNFNLDKLIRETKVEFNKNIIKSKGGNFKEKLNQVFNINL